MNKDVNINSEKILRLHKLVSNSQKIQNSIETMSEEEYLSEIEENAEKLNNFKQKYGISKIGEGRDRVTFTSGSLVSSSRSNVIIKISKSDGTMQNEEEIKIWNEMGEETREHIASIYDWGNPPFWIVQERVDQITSRDATKKLIDNLNDCGWVSSDIRPENVGERSGHPVLMDLGVGLRKK